MKLEEQDQVADRFGFSKASGWQMAAFPLSSPLLLPVGLSPGVFLFLEGPQSLGFEPQPTLSLSGFSKDPASKHSHTGQGVSLQIHHSIRNRSVLCLMSVTLYNVRSIQPLGGMYQQLPPYCMNIPRLIYSWLLGLFLVFYCYE